MRQRGFVLGAVLVLAGLAALLMIDALTTAALAQAAVTRLRLRAEVFELAEGGLAMLALRLTERGSTIDANPATPGSTLTTTTRLRAIESTPEGFSAGLFRVEHFDLAANATGPRGTRLVVEAGVSRWSALP